jgi:hypothetical protein
MDSQSRWSKQIRPPTTEPQVQIILRIPPKASNKYRPNHQDWNSSRLLDAFCHLALEEWNLRLKSCNGEAPKCHPDLNDAIPRSEPWILPRRRKCASAGELRLTLAHPPPVTSCKLNQAREACHDELRTFVSFLPFSVACLPRLAFVLLL